MGKGTVVRMELRVCFSLVLAVVVLAAPSRAGHSCAGCGGGEDGWKQGIEAEYHDSVNYWPPFFSYTRGLQRMGTTSDGSPAAIIVPKRGSQLALEGIKTSTQTVDLASSRVGGTAYLVEHEGTLVIMTGCVRIFGEIEIYCLDDGFTMASAQKRMAALEKADMIGTFTMNSGGDNTRIIEKTTSVLEKIWALQNSRDDGDTSPLTETKITVRAEQGEFEGMSYNLLTSGESAVFLPEKPNPEVEAVNYVVEAGSRTSTDKTLFTTGVATCHAVIVKKSSASRTSYALLHVLGTKLVAHVGMSIHTRLGYYAEKGAITLMAMYMQRDGKDLTQVFPSDESIAFFQEVSADTKFTYVIAKSAKSYERVLDGTRSLLSDYYGFEQVGEISVDRDSFDIGVNPRTGRIFVPLHAYNNLRTPKSVEVDVYSYPDRVPLE